MGISPDLKFSLVAISQIIKRARQSVDWREDKMGQQLRRYLYSFGGRLYQTEIERERGETRFFFFVFCVRAEGFKILSPLGSLIKESSGHRRGRGSDERWSGEMNGTMIEAECVRGHNWHVPMDDQCSSIVVKHIQAPLHLVWSLVRRFDEPQKYKPFVSRCVVQGEPEIGSLREVNVKSGLPATTSTERLELLDDNQHIIGVKIVGGDHRLKNYTSFISLHPESIGGTPGTLVIESFVVDVPEGNTKDETCFFVEALIKCNLKSLADVSGQLAVQDRTEIINQ